MRIIVIQFGNGRREVWREGERPLAIRIYFGNGRTVTWTEDAPAPRVIEGSARPARPRLEVLK